MKSHQHKFYTEDEELNHNALIYVLEIILDEFMSSEVVLVHCHQMSVEHVGNVLVL